MEISSKPAVVLLSGGLDSTTALAIAKTEGFSLYALSFRYGQRHKVEVTAARRIAKHIGVAQHRVISIDLRWIGGSALTAPVPVPKGRSAAEMGRGVPSTYVPARNTILLSYALAWAEVIGANDIFAGFNVLDASGYPDCRAAFVNAYERMANLATRASVEWHKRLQIHVPLIALTKAQIIAKGLELGAPYHLTSSCYAPAGDGAACGLCDTCQLRRKGFADVGIPDPIRYATTEQAS